MTTEAVTRELAAIKDLFPILAKAAEALGSLHDARAVEPLIAALNTSFAGTSPADHLLRPSVAKALGDLGDPRAVEPLIDCLKDRDGIVRVQAETLALISKAEETKDETQRRQLKLEAVQRCLSDVKQRAEAEEKMAMTAVKAQDKLKEANAQESDPYIQKQAIKRCLPKERDKNAIYWVQRVGSSYSLTQTIPCQSGGGVFIAETIVPCGAVFVNQENQIGGSYFFVTASEEQEPSETGKPNQVEELLNVAWRNAGRCAAVEALDKFGEAAVDPLIAVLKRQHVEFGK
jgi:hypothetical protein